MARITAIQRAHRGSINEEQLAAYPAAHGPVPDSSPRNRRHDLVRAGILVDSGERRPLRSGRMGIVWRLARVVERVAS